ncbi:hypothetical protein [Isoalcanivorax indicus]|uniref:hypothetical protein n=1 Tax=Isoalcanivorax indicus TaxID=2202653 RepID=UPI0013C533B2|nr:hypothetical protein [Isoalcanivorax indicus]
MIRLLPQRPPLNQADPDGLVSRFRTGDLLLFAGRGLPSDTIRLFTRSHWSHVGMVVCLPDYDQPLLLEATAGGDAPDIRTGAPTPGVALVPVRDKIEVYGGDVAWRARQGAPLSPARERMVARLVRQFSHRPYKNFMQALMRDLVTGFQLRPDLSGVFCSELVAEVYRRLGWLPRHDRSSGYVPGHFGSQRLQLLHGSMAPPVLLKTVARLAPVAGAVTASAVSGRGTPSSRSRNGVHGTLPLLQ